jgi:molybdopterin adenylyltransferase
VQLPAKVLTISDGVVAGTREDAAGPALVAQLTEAGYAVVDQRVVPDGVAAVSEAIVELAAGFAGLLLTTGGTGFSPRDLTPEATRRVLEREAPGLVELARAASPLGALSRGMAGTRGACLVVNLPGSPRGALESFAALAALLPHALELLSGGHPH